jgi:hypothetical protein
MLCNSYTLFPIAIYSGQFIYIILHCILCGHLTQTFPGFPKRISRFAVLFKNHKYGAKCQSPRKFWDLRKHLHFRGRGEGVNFSRWGAKYFWGCSPPAPQKICLWISGIQNYCKNVNASCKFLEMIYMICELKREY